jgi:glutaredoxin
MEPLQIVKIFTAPQCKHSHAAKVFLDRHDILYMEHDVTENRAAYDEMVEKSHTSAVPMIEVENHIFSGFDEESLKKVLKIKSA